MSTTAVSSDIPNTLVIYAYTQYTKIQKTCTHSAKILDKI